MAKVLDCGLKVSKFKSQLCYYVHLQTNALGKYIEHFYPQSSGSNSVMAVFYKDGFGIK